MREIQTPPIVYNLFPRLAGPFTNWGPHLERAAAMGFNWIFVNPIQACGYSGSMYAIKDHYRIDSRYIDFRTDLSPEEQLQAVLVRAHDLGLRVMLDLVINHTAFDSELVENHPDWYKRDGEGKPVRPSAPDTGQVWGDLATIDNENSRDRDNLWRYWEYLLAHYLSLGLDGFRCDAAYQVPIPLWSHLIHRAKSIEPDTKFFAETLGCDFRLVLELSRAGFDYNFNSSKWWNFKDSWALQQYEENRLNGSPSISFPESHDTTRLAADLNGNVAGVKMRYLFAALYSTGVMVPSGFEYCFSNQLDVVQTKPEDWEPIRFDIGEFIRATNALKTTYQVFAEENPIDVVSSANEQIFAMRKTGADMQTRALTIVNTDLVNQQSVRIDNIRELLGQPLEMRNISVEPAQDEVLSDCFAGCLQPGQVVILYGER